MGTYRLGLALLAKPNVMAHGCILHFKSCFKTRYAG